MRCIEWCGRSGLAGLALLAGCSSGSLGTRAGTSPSVVTFPSTAPESSSLAAAGTPGAAAAALPAPRHVRNWSDVRLQAAQRMVAADPRGTYTSTPPDPLLAIPVLEIELNGDGSVRRIVVLRMPRQARDTVQIATNAVRRAAPFGDVSRLPRPWKFVETFLFDDDRRFKPRTLEP